MLLLIGRRAITHTIRNLAEQIDAHRKRQQAQHPGLTLTGLYNVLDALRRATPLSDKERDINSQGLVSLLAELHDQLDAAVFAAYGWPDLAERLVGCPGATSPWPEKPAAQLEAEEELLTRLVALNSERAAEEAKGVIRWLRPAYQAADTATASAAPAAERRLRPPSPGDQRSDGRQGAQISTSACRHARADCRRARGAGQPGAEPR